MLFFVFLMEKGNKKLIQNNNNNNQLMVILVQLLLPLRTNAGRFWRNTAELLSTKISHSKVIISSISLISMSFLVFFKFCITVLKKLDLKSSLPSFGEPKEPAVHSCSVRCFKNFVKISQQILGLQYNVEWSEKIV